MAESLVIQKRPWWRSGMAISAGIVLTTAILFYGRHYEWDKDFINWIDGIKNDWPTPEERFDAAVVEQKNAGRIVVNELSDIPEAKREAFINDLIRRIGWGRDDLSPAEQRVLALKIIDAGGYSVNGRSYMLWYDPKTTYSAIGFPSYVQGLPDLDARPVAPVATPHPVVAETPVAEQPAPAVPPPAEPVEEERVVEKPKPKNVMEHSNADVETAEQNIDGIADRTEAQTATPEQLESLKAFLAEKGMRVTDEEAREIFTRGWYERDGRTYTLWASTERMSPAVLEAVVTHPDGTTSVRRVPLAAFFETPRA